MADGPIDEPTILTNLSKLDGQLAMCFDDNGVTREMQARLARANFTDVRKFRHFGRNDESVLKGLKDHFGLNEEASLAKRAEVSSIMAAWHASAALVKRKNEADAEASVAQQAKVIRKGDYLRLRAAYELVFGELDDDQVPGKLS